MYLDWAKCKHRYLATTPIKEKGLSILEHKKRKCSQVGRRPVHVWNFTVALKVKKNIELSVWALSIGPAVLELASHAIEMANMLM